MAMMFAVLMGVVARGIFRLTLGASTQRSLYHERARQASISGIEYARTQLALNSDWKGDSTSQTTISTDSLVVKEIDGNVFGLLTYPDGGKGHFRIRFNHQNDASGASADGLADPPSHALIQSHTLSVNNLQSNTPASVPDQDGNYAVVPASEDGSVPAHSVLLEVEGRAGLGVNELTANSMTGDPEGTVQSIMAQSILKVEVDEPNTPAVLQSAGDMDIITVEGVTVDSLDENNPSIRSKQAIAVTTADNRDGQLTMDDGHVYAANEDFQADYDSNEITVHDEAAATDLSNLTWDQVSRPSTNSTKIPAGTYVLWPAMAVTEAGRTTTTPSEFHYYPMDYANYKARVYDPYIRQGQLPSSSQPELYGTVLNPTNPAIRGSQGLTDFARSVTIRDDTVHIRRDIIVDPKMPSSAEVPNPTLAKDFAVIPLFDGAMKDADAAGLPVPTDFPSSYRPTGPADLQLVVDNARIYSQGNMIIKGASVRAQGATLIGEGSLTLNAPALSVHAGESNLSLYFKGDIHLSSYNIDNNTYGNFDLMGIIYSWGDVQIDMGDPDSNYDVDYWGNLNFTGSMVAYGGDPLGEVPGYNGDGAIGIRSRATNIHHDPTKVTQLANPEELNTALIISSVGSWFRL